MKIDFQKPRWWLNPIVFALLVLVLAFTLPGPEAHAQSVEIPTIDQLRDASNTTPQDASLKIMQGLFGVDSIAAPFEPGAPKTPLQQGVYVFNAVLFILIGVYSFIRFFEFILNTAATGHPLGADENSGWRGPIRWVFGIIGSAPIFSGYSLAQAMLLWTLSLGIGAANHTRDLAISSITNAQFLPEPAPTAAGASTPQSIEDIAMSAALFSICSADLTESNNSILYSDPGNTPPQFNPTYTGTKNSWSTTRTVAEWSGCGSIQLRRQEEGDKTTKDGSYAAIQYQEIAARAQKANEAALNQIAKGIPQIISAHWYNDGWSRTPDAPMLTTENIDALIDDIRKFAALTKDALRQNLTAALPADNQSQAEAISRLKDGGWLQTPSLYQTRSESEAAQLAALNAYALISDQTKYAEALITKNINGNQNLSFGLRHLLERKQATDPKSNGLCPVDRTSNGNCSIGQAILRNIAGAAATDNQSRIDPLMAAKYMGDTVMIIGETLLVSAALPLDKIPGVGAAASFLLGGAIEKAQGAAAVLGWVFLGVGALLAIYIPLIPFLTWVNAVISWFFSVLEALIQSGISLLTHLNPATNSSQFATGSSAKVYTSSLNLILRPTVMVLGFFAAAQALPYIGAWVYQAFFHVVGQIQGDSVTGLVSIIGFLLVFALLLFGLVQTTFSLVLIELPNRLLGILGGESATPAATVAVAGAAGAMVSGGGASLASEATSTARTALSRMTSPSSGEVRVPGGKAPTPTPAAPAK